jgi:hypothetical protein
LAKDQKIALGVECPWRVLRRGHMAPGLSRAEDVGGSAEVVGDGGEGELEGGFREAAPSRAPEAVAAFPPSEDLLDPAADALDRTVSGGELLRRVLVRPAPHGSNGHPRVPDENQSAAVFFAADLDGNLPPKSLTFRSSGWSPIPASPTWQGWATRPSPSRMGSSLCTPGARDPDPSARGTHRLDRRTRSRAAILACQKRGEPASGGDPRHWCHHRHCDRSDRHRCGAVPVGRAVRRLARAKTPAAVHRRQDAPWRDIEAGRPVSPPPAGRRRHRRDAPSGRQGDPACGLGPGAAGVSPSGSSRSRSPTNLRGSRGPF